MNAPTQVQRQAEEAERRLQTITGTQTSPEETPPAATPPAEATPPAAPAPAEKSELDALREQLAAEQHRYRTLQGMYEADRRRSSEQVDNLTAKVEELLTRSAAPAAATPASQPYGERDLEDFGAETLDMVKRVSTATATAVANEIVERVLAQRLAPVTNTVQDVASRVQKSAEQEYYDSLTDTVADWKTINESPQFLQWLQIFDPLSGIPRQVLLQDAHQKLDAGRVAAVFNQFKLEAGIGAQPAAQQTRQPVVDERAAMVEPARTAATPRPSGKPGGKTYTRADIQKFYRDSAAGRIPAAEAQAIEQDIIRAQSEGRIVG